MLTISGHGRPLALLCLAAIFPALGCGEDAPPPELPPRAIQWLSVSAGVADERRVISGIVTAVSDTVLAFEVGGIVETVEVHLGDRVEKDQVLVRLDPEPFELTVRDAEAALAEARALREAARADYERAVRLFEEQVASRQEFDRATAMRGSRDSQVEAAQARLNLARRDLRRSVLRAPFEGSISVREVDPAMKVGGGQTVLEMDSKETGLRVEVQMPETLIAGVHQGDEVEVSFPSIGEGGPRLDGRSFQAFVSEVGTRAGAGNAFPVRADLTSPPAGLRPGMTAEVVFTLGAAEDVLTDIEGFMIPIGAALAEPGDGFAVFVFDRETSRVNKRAIRSGGVRDNDLAVLEGLSEGEIIATAGVPFLRDGQQVTLLQEAIGRSTR